MGVLLAGWVVALRPTRLRLLAMDARRFDLLDMRVKPATPHPNSHGWKKTALASSPSERGGAPAFTEELAAMRGGLTA